MDMIRKLMHRHLESGHRCGKVRAELKANVFVERGTRNTYVAVDFH